MKVIATTSINPPTEAIRAFDNMPGWMLVVAGDRKTPTDYTLEHGVYLSPRYQQFVWPELSAVIGWDCLQRRNFALLYAAKLNADVVAIVDDDNIPMPGWGENLHVNKAVHAHYYETEAAAFDPVGATNHFNLWHRGFPLQLLASRDYTRHEMELARCDIQADFWNGDPDVDAVCRAIYAPNCHFSPLCFPIASNKPGPFNSQNTFIAGHVLKDYFLPPGVGRMDDIWAGYYAQAMGHRVVWCAPSVVQKRNPHDLTVDMRAEYLGYEHTLDFIRDTQAEPARVAWHYPARAMRAWEIYRRLICS